MPRTLKRKPAAWVPVAGSEAAGDLVEFHMTPASSLQYDMAVERAMVAARELKDSEKVRADYGLENFPPEAVAEDAEKALGVSTTMIATELALIIATDMRGYLAETGDGPALFSRRSVALAMQDWHNGKSVAKHFLDKVLVPVFEAKQEGKP